MRVALLVAWRSGHDSGIYRKVADQAAEWTRLGAEVGIHVATEADAAAEWRALPQTVHVELPADGRGGKIAQRERLFRAVAAWAPDVVYARHALALPGFVRLAARHVVVVEVNGDDRTEFRQFSRVQHLYNEVTRGLLLRRAAGLVFVTRELASRPDFARFARPSVVVGNGIRLADLPQLGPAPPDSRRAFFVGHPGSPWHGVDKIVAVAERLPDWRFDLVGPLPHELPAAPANVVAHGLMRRVDYLPLAEAAAVAIGSLAMHRAGISEGSTLKVREYLGLGLPTVLGHRDTDFPDGAPFLLTVPNTEDNVTVLPAAMSDFAARWGGRRVPREEVSRLDVSVKEQQRVEFFRSLLDR